MTGGGRGRNTRQSAPSRSGLSRVVQTVRTGLFCGRPLTIVLKLSRIGLCTRVRRAEIPFSLHREQETQPPRGVEYTHRRCRRPCGGCETEDERPTDTFGSQPELTRTPYCARVNSNAGRSCEPYTSYPPDTFRLNWTIDETELKLHFRLWSKRRNYIGYDFDFTIDDYNDF